MIVLSNISKVFDNGKQALTAVDNVNLTIEQGQIYGIIGYSGAGKSTLINALLEKDVLPTDVLPATATVNRVTYGVTPLARIEYHDGRVEDIDLDRLEEYVTKLTPESERIATSIG